MLSTSDMLVTAIQIFHVLLSSFQQLFIDIFFIQHFLFIIFIFRCPTHVYQRSNLCLADVRHELYHLKYSPALKPFYDSVWCNTWLTAGGGGCSWQYLEDQVVPGLLHANHVNPLRYLSGPLNSFQIGKRKLKQHAYINTVSGKTEI